jgi:hypothetical protein
MKKNSLGTKLLMAAVTLALLVYFGIQAYNYFEDPLTTTLAYTDLVEESVSLSGYVIREEQILSGESSGLLRLQRAEGERVSSGGTVAVVYADQTSWDRQAEIESLTTRIEQLQYAKEAALGVEVTQKLDAQITQNLLDYRTALAADRMSDAESQGTTLRALVMKRDYSEADIENVSAQITELETELKTLQSQAAGSVRRITAPQTGLYSAVVDGYETVLTPSGLDQLTPSTLATVQADASVQSDVGKLILGQDWYYAAVMSTTEAQAMQKRQSEGTSLYLRFSKAADRNLEVTLDSVGQEENGRCVAVFKGDTYLSELTLLRQQSAQVIYSSTEGIRVPKEALRAVKTSQDQDGGRTTTEALGVYCIMGVEARFKPVTVLYSGENFVLVAADDSTGSETLRLRPGDEVILTAKDLYDGKIVGETT